MNSLDKQAIEIANQMVSDGIATKVLVESETGAYWYLASPDATTAPLTVIASLGSPELCGVWSYTLLSMGLMQEASMESYFKAFKLAGLGFIAINPNCNGPDLMGECFVEQFTHAAGLLSSRRFGMLGFSMGGGMALQFIEGTDGMAERVAGLALIDPTLPGRIRPRRSKEILTSQSLLVSSDNPQAPGLLASHLLDIPARTYPGLHGEIPARALAEVVYFFQSQVS